MMASLHLPVAHTEDDLAIAGALAQLLNSEELYVAWSTDGGAARPVIPAKLYVPGQEDDEDERGHEDEPPRHGLLTWIKAFFRGI